MNGYYTKQKPSCDDIESRKRHLENQIDEVNLQIMEMLEKEKMDRLTGHLPPEPPAPESFTGPDGERIIIKPDKVKRTVITREEVVARMGLPDAEAEKIMEYLPPEIHITRKE